MSDAKHTPGPWEAREDRADGHTGPAGMVFWEVVRLDSLAQGPDDPNRHTVCDLGPERSDGTTQHDARLIAAAPDMLIALKLVTTWMRRTKVTWTVGAVGQILKHGEDAIRKATGS